MLPLTALNDALRGVVNEGRPFDGVLPQVAILAAWGGLSFRVGAEVVPLAIERGSDYVPRGLELLDDYPRAAVRPARTASASTGVPAADSCSASLCST